MDARSRAVTTAYRTAFGLLGFSAVVTEIATLHERGRFDAANFFSFFTIQSNVIAAAVLVGSSLAHGAAGERRGYDLLRGAATLYLAITGLVFSLLLSGLQGVEFTAVAWDNLVLHYLMPAFVVVDWAIAPPRRQIAFRDGLIWLAYPVAYVVYSLIRGAAVDWYPYPFLDPALRGYTGVTRSSIGIALTAAALVFVIAALTRPSPFLDRLRGRDGEAVADP